MRRHQRSTSILVFVALVAAVMPSTALANSLLSGYGGPGQGNQAMLGSALLNAPKGGGGSSSSDSGGSSGSSSRDASGQSGEVAAPQGSQASGASRQGARERSSAAARSSAEPAARGATERASQGASVIYPAASSEVTSGGSRALGLSGADFVYIILALGVLALVGFLTLRLARTTVTRRPDGRL